MKSSSAWQRKSKRKRNENRREYTIEGFTLSIAYPGGVLLFYDQAGPRPRSQ